LDHNDREQVSHRFRTLRYMSYIPTLLASIDARLDELAAEISTLESGRAALGTPTPAAPAIAPNGAARKRRRRLTPAARTPELEPTAPAVDPKAELAAAVANGASSEPPKPRRRAAATAAPKQRSGASLTAEQLERLLAEGASGLSAGAIAERAGVSYSRVLARLRELEASGRVRRTGSRRSTLWLLITDEERIAQRAAELERLVGARRDDRSQRRGRARAS
jgi:DNA-binding MarR family transcriptional regulator